jgi:hypothetical protein
MQLYITEIYSSKNIGRLVEFMETSISGELRAAKASELLKMVIY